MVFGPKFINLGKNRVFVSPSAYHTDETWVKPQARNDSMWLDDNRLHANDLIRDHASKSSESVDHLFRCTGIDIVKTPHEAPATNCYAEWWIGTLKCELEWSMPADQVISLGQT